MDAYATATTTGGTAIEETDRLIASDKVEGTAVYNRHGERLGTVQNFTVDKSTGRVAYAVMSFGGFLGMGESYHPLLNYDTRQGGFVIDLDRCRLKEGPRWRATCRTGPTGPTAAGSTSLRRAVLLDHDLIG
jgi:hypothetical protein